MARPTSPWVKPSLIRRCLNVLANCSSSSRSVVSSGDGSRTRGADESFCICGVCVPELGVEGVRMPPTLIWATFGGVFWLLPGRIVVGVGRPGLPAGLCSGELARAELVCCLICCCFCRAWSCWAAWATYWITLDNMDCIILIDIFLGVEVHPTHQVWVVFMLIINWVTGKSFTRPVPYPLSYRDA